MLDTWYYIFFAAAGCERTLLMLGSTCPGLLVHNWGRSWGSSAYVWRCAEVSSNMRSRWGWVAVLELFSLLLDCLGLVFACPLSGFVLISSVIAINCIHTVLKTFIWWFEVFLKCCEWLISTRATWKHGRPHMFTPLYASKHGPKHSLSIRPSSEDSLIHLKTIIWIILLQALPLRQTTLAHRTQSHNATTKHETTTLKNDHHHIYDPRTWFFHWKYTKFPTLFAKTLKSSKPKHPRPNQTYPNQHQSLWNYSVFTCIHRFWVSHYCSQALSWLPTGEALNGDHQLHPAPKPRRRQRQQPHGAPAAAATDLRGGVAWLQNGFVRNSFSY